MECPHAFFEIFFRFRMFIQNFFMEICTALISPCPTSVFKIFLFPDSHNTDDQLVLDNPERRPVFTNPDPVPWLFGRASSYFLHVLTMKRVRSIFLKRDLNSDACRLGQRCKSFLCPVGKFYPVCHHSTRDRIALSSPRSFIMSRRLRTCPALISFSLSLMSSIS